MRAGCALACALLLGASGARAESGGPVEAAVKFHEARQAGRCSEVWGLFSRGAQEKIRDEGSHCGRIGKLKPGTARLVRQVGAEAVVSATFRGAPPRHELDFAAPFAEYSEQLDLIREDGAWKAELRRTLIQSSQARLLVPAGAVEWRRDPLEGGIHHKLEVTVASRVPQDALEAVLRDPKAWAVAIPSVKSIEALPPTAQADRALLSFADASPPLPVTLSLRGRVVDPKLDWTSLEWTAEQGLEAPVYIKGSWNLKPNADGTTRVNLTLVLNPRHWPRYDRLFSATRLAKALDNIQLAAGKKP